MFVQLERDPMTLGLSAAGPSKEMDSGNWFKEIGSLLLAAAVGWLISSFSRVNKSEFDEFRKGVTARLEALDKNLSDRVTRVELKEVLEEFKYDWRESMNEIKVELRALRGLK